MKRCHKCQIEILDDVDVCPLCRHGLEECGSESVRPMYPVVEFSRQKFNLLIRLFMFVSILLGLSLIVINMAAYEGTWWSLIGAGGIAYFWLTVKYSIQTNTNYAAKILVQSIAGMVFILLVDWVTGYQGWSVNYAIPSVILVGYLGITILMMVNYMNWQSYILFQIELIAMSLILVGLYFCGIVTKPLLSYVTAAITVVIFIGTIVFGDKKAKNELKRRFHI